MSHILQAFTTKNLFSYSLKLSLLVSWIIMYGNLFHLEIDVNITIFFMALVLGLGIITWPLFTCLVS